MKANNLERVVLADQRRDAPPNDFLLTIERAERQKRRRIIVAFVLGIALVVGATAYATVPRYAYDHGSATIEELRDVVTHHASPVRRTEARTILLTRALECVDAIKASRTISNMHELEIVLEHIRKAAR